MDSMTTGLLGVGSSVVSSGAVYFMLQQEIKKSNSDLQQLKAEFTEAYRRQTAAMREEMTRMTLRITALEKENKKLKSQKKRDSSSEEEEIKPRGRKVRFSEKRKASSSEESSSGEELDEIELAANALRSK